MTPRLLSLQYLWNTLATVALAAQVSQLSTAAPLARRGPWDERPGLACPGTDLHPPMSPAPAPELPGGPSVFIFPPKIKDALMITGKPTVTCVVVDVIEDVKFSWYVDDNELDSAETKNQEIQENDTYRIVSTLEINHRDWLNGKEFKCKVNSSALPAPVQRTISKAKGGAAGRWGGGGGGRSSAL